MTGREESVLERVRRRREEKERFTGNSLERYDLRRGTGLEVHNRRKDKKKGILV